MNRMALLVFGGAASWGMASVTLAADEPTQGCTAMASRVAAATRGKLEFVEGEGYSIIVAGARSAYYGCANGAEGFSIDGAGSGLSEPVARAVAAAATVIAGRHDPALRRGASACVKAAVSLAYHGKAGFATMRHMNRRKHGEVTAGGLHFLCTFFTDGSEPPVFFVGPGPTAH